MTQILNKTVTVKQLLGAGCVALVALVVWWGWELISEEWRMKIGDISAEKSPYFSSIPLECKAYAGRSRER